MSASVRVCFVFILFVFGANGLTDLFCKDPDTGEFHAVNKTWSSSTVCGNYTCRIRRRIKQDMDTHASEVHVINTPIKQDMDTHASEVHVINTPIKQDMDTHASNILILSAPPISINETKEAKTIEDSKNNIDNETTAKEHNRSILDILKSDIENRTGEQDRYLSDSEIRSISELLHMVKKSDLEAVVEVYNLAQDIYRELESAPVENKKDLYMHVLNKIKTDRPPKVPINEGSYWYEPQIYLDEEKSDAQIAASEPVISKPIYPQFNYPYYNTPYYYQYPASTFHRHASYVNPTRELPPAQPNIEYFRAQTNPPCPYARREESTLLPYPFTPVNQFNQSSPYRAYWTQQPYKYAPIVKTYEQPIKAILVNPEMNNDVQDIEQHLDKRDESKAKLVLKDNIREQDNERNKPKTLFDTDDLLPLWLTAPLARNNEETLAPWQTAPLSEHVLDEVKANILENTEKLLNPFKKLKLEKVAKVLKLDDLTRPKRETVEIIEPVSIDDLDFEVYIEKITCTIETEPGLFSVGNLTAPFPECCPKRIN